MRFLFDEQLSERLPGMLADVFPGSIHVRTLTGVGATDERVWNLAVEHGCLLVTKDETSIATACSVGLPPKVVVDRLGNCATEDVAHLLRHHAEGLQAFADQGGATFLLPSVERRCARLAPIRRHGRAFKHSESYQDLSGVHLLRTRAEALLVAPKRQERGKRYASELPQVAATSRNMTKAH
jgi:predicted nuclease of predicted toxin-antitoxin system